MKLFEPYYAILDGYAFATPQDRENALWAALWASQARNVNDEIVPAFRPPMVVIEGPMASGKTRLAAALSELAGQAGCYGIPREMDLNMIAAMERSIAWFDDVPRLSKKMSEMLAAFITAKRWGFRLLGTRNHREVSLYCLTVLTAGGLELPADLERRAIRIRLEAIKHPVSTKKLKGGSRL